MPSSSLPLLATTALVALEHRPARVLDVGPGNGKYGVILREYGHRHLELLDAVEAEPRYLESFPWLSALYDHVYTTDVVHLVDHSLARYDLVLMVDVLEHLTHDDGEELLRRIPGRVVVSTPRDFFQNPEADQGWPTERHRSVWTVDELAAVRDLEVVDVDAFDKLGGIIVRAAPL